jgi:hypothetical protein
VERVLMIVRLALFLVAIAAACDGLYIVAGALVFCALGAAVLGR